MPFSALADALAEADVLLTSTGCRLDRRSTPTWSRRGHAPARPLLVVDVAVPRDVDAAVADLPGVTLLDLDDLRDWAGRGVAERAAEAAKVGHIVAEEVEPLRRGGRGPPGRAARGRSSTSTADGVRQGRAASASPASWPTLDERERATVEALTRAIVAKLLHEPTVQSEGATPARREGERNADGVRDLFDL